MICVENDIFAAAREQNCKKLCYIHIMLKIRRERENFQSHLIYLFIEQSHTTQWNEMREREMSQFTNLKFLNHESYVTYFCENNISRSSML